jgi:hypothetical protein
VLKLAEIIAVSHFLYNIDQIAVDEYSGKSSLQCPPPSRTR